MNGNSAPTVLHDTSSVSRYLTRGPDTQAFEFFRAPHVPAISFQAEAELEMWALRPSTPPVDREHARRFLETATVLQSNSEINRLFAEIMVARMLA